MPWVQAVPLSDLPVWKIKLQNDGGAIVLRGGTACCAHSLALAHLQAERCFLPRAWKLAKRRQRRMKRASFEEAARLASPTGAGIVMPRRRPRQKTDQDYLPPCGRLGQPLAALPLYGCRIPLAGKSLRRCFAPRGRGIRERRTGGSLHRMSWCCFDNFNASRLRARNVGERYLF